MAKKIFILFLNLAFIQIVNGGCTGDAQNSIGLMGGWSDVNMDHLSDDLRARIAVYTQQALSMWSDRTNDFRLFRPVKTDIENVPKITSIYKQLVNGMNYCVEFMAEPFQCRNGDTTNKYCIDGLYSCEFKVYEPFGVLIQGAPSDPEINPDDVTCEPKEKKRRVIHSKP